MTATISRFNAYGGRYHVIIIGKTGVQFSGKTKLACRDYCKRHGLKVVALPHDGDL